MEIYGLMYWYIFSKRKRRWYNEEAAELAAASKRFGHARGEESRERNKRRFARAIFK